MSGSILAEVDRLVLENGLTLRLLSALEILEVRREGETMSQDEGERALCRNACLVAHSLELEGKAVFPDGKAVLSSLTLEEIARLAKEWGAFNRRVNPSIQMDGREADLLKKN